jgi:hypothetical protein
MALACAAAALVIGCQAKQQPFADVPAADRSEMAPLVTAPAEPRVAALQQAQAAPAEPVAPVAVETPVVPVTPPAPVPAAPPAVASAETAPAAPAVTPPAPTVGMGLAPEADRYILRPADAALQSRADVVLNISEGGVLRRAWPVTAAYIPSGDTLAWPHYWNTVGRAIYRNDWENAILEPLEFLGNTVLLPVRAVMLPPWVPVVNSPAGPAAEERLLIGQPWVEGAAPAADR